MPRAGRATAPSISPVWTGVTYQEVLAAGKEVYSEFKNLCVWKKSNAGMGSLYRSQFELIFVFKVGKGPHINNVRSADMGGIGPMFGTMSARTR